MARRRRSPLPNSLPRRHRRLWRCTRPRWARAGASRASSSTPSGCPSWPTSPSTPRSRTPASPVAATLRSARTRRSARWALWTYCCPFSHCTSWSTVSRRPSAVGGRSSRACREPTMGGAPESLAMRRGRMEEVIKWAARRGNEERTRMELGASPTPLPTPASLLPALARSLRVTWNLVESDF